MNLKFNKLMNSTHATLVVVLARKVKVVSPLFLAALQSHHSVPLFPFSRFSPMMVSTRRPLDFGSHPNDSSWKPSNMISTERSTEFSLVPYMIQLLFPAFPLYISNYEI